MLPNNNYLNKHDMLVEIDLSKISYSQFIAPEYAKYHAIVPTLADITDELISEVIAIKGKGRGKIAPLILKPDQVVIRVMTHDHIPLDPDRKRKARNTDQSYAWTNFPPFKHYIRRDGELIEVGRSHWTGTFETGSFTATKGKMTDALGIMFMLLVERIARKPNFRGYSYIDEMQGKAIENLCHAGLQFDESKGDNPFAFYTTAVNNSFVRVLNLEKRTQNIRDDMLMAAGAKPSSTRQMADELDGLGGPVALSKVSRKRPAKVSAVTVPNFN